MKKGKIMIDDGSFNKLQSKVDQIHDFLMGEGMYKDAGAIDRIKSVETEQRLMKKWFFLAIGGGSVVVFLLKYFV